MRFNKFIVKSVLALTLINTTGPLYAKTLNDQNTQFGVLLLHTLPSSLSSSMTLEEISEQNTELDSIRSALIKSLKQSLFPIMRASLSKTAGEDLAPNGEINIHSEILRSVSIMTDLLKKNLRNIKLKESVDFNIMMTPTFTEALRAKNLNNEEVPFKFLYANDKLSIFEPMVNLNQSSESFLKNEVYQASLRMLYEHRIEAPQDPALLTVSMHLTLHPNMNDSKISLQSMIAMPLAKKIDFSKDTDQIALTHVLLPDPGFDRNLIDAATSEQPCAFEQIVFPFDSSKDIIMHLTFGPIGTFNGTFWIPSPDIKDRVKYVPKLFGKPKFNGNKIPLLDIGFSLTSLSFNMTQTKVKELDLYLSIGTPRFKIGNFNKPDIDSQFEGEINKAIQEQMNQLKSTGIEKIESVTPNLVEILVNKLFQKQFRK